MNLPALSVVLTTDRFSTIRVVIERLREQTAAHLIELVIVVPGGHDVEPSKVGEDGFAATRIVELDAIHPMTLARAAGIRAATAPVVFLGETHSFPHPEFAAVLIEAHRGPWDVVVPGLGNANPRRALSWAAFLPDYGMWSDALSAGEIDRAPTWNVAYKRGVLLDLGERLDQALRAGDEAASAFRASRRRIWFEPAARLDHANVARLASWIEERYLTGLLIGASRRARWPFWRRLLYTAALPLIAVVVLSRLVPPVRALARRGILPHGTIPAVFAGVLVRTLGEGVGYVAGAGARAEPRLEMYEVDKLKYTAGRLAG